MICPSFFIFRKRKEADVVRFYADNYFHIGHAHLGTGKPCQDYSFSEVYDQIGFGAVSDGCSSGRHTDIGSRVITLSTASFVRQLDQFNLSNFQDVQKDITEAQAKLIKLTQKSLGLELEDMLATSGYILLSPSGGFVHLRGDGAVAIVYRNSQTDLYSYQWNKNTPFYPAYAADNYIGFIKEHGGDLDAPVVKIEHWLKQPGGKICKLDDGTMSLAQGIAGASHYFSTEEIKNNLAFVAIFTDGVNQVASTVGGQLIMPWQDVVQELIGFVSLNGQFAKRNAIWLIKQLRKKNIGPLDDIGYAVVRIEPDEGGRGDGA